MYDNQKGGALVSLNARIKEARLSKGLTQEQLGKLIGVAKTTVAGYEKNREPDAYTIGAIIDALNVDANYLFQDEMRELQSNSFSIPEIDIIKKYRSLDEYGKSTIDLMLDREYERSKHSNRNEEIAAEFFPSTEPKLTEDDERELELIKQEMLAEKRGRTSSASTSAKDA